MAVLTEEPPDDAAYQLTVQEEAGVTPNATVPVPHRELVVAAVGTAGTAFTVPVHASRVALSQPDALTLAAYNVVVALMLGENGLAVLVIVPPDDAVYHFTVQPLPGVTWKSTVPGPHRELVLALVGAAGSKQAEDKTTLSKKV